MKTWKSWLLPVDKRVVYTVVALVIELGTVPSWRRKIEKRSVRARTILVPKAAWERKCDAVCIVEIVFCTFKEICL